MRWAYGVTTVESRLDKELPRTLLSLVNGGFPAPTLYVDGARSPSRWAHFGCPVTVRDPKVRAYGNWVLSAWELYIRNPSAQLYAVFQDDVLMCRNVRAYLESCTYPEGGYWNLFTFPENQVLSHGPGWYLSDQRGKGALALVFSRAVLQKLLANEHTVKRVVDVLRGHRAIDGGIVTALALQGVKEYVHDPSLVQHMGTASTMDHGPFPAAPSFKGEDFDALCLVGRR